MTTMSFTLNPETVESIYSHLSSWVFGCPQNQGKCYRFYLDPVICVPNQGFRHLVAFNHFFRYYNIMSKPGSGGVASGQDSNVDRRARLRELALETIDLNNDPYFMRYDLPYDLFLIVSKR